ncbi:MAG: LytR C-terminal domain-containing protein [Sporichthyaceae bacterium]
MSDPHHVHPDQQSPPPSRVERGPVTELARLFLVQLAAVIGIATAIVVIVALVDPGGDGDVTTAAPGSSGTPTATPAASGDAAASAAPAPTSSSAPGAATPSDTATTSPASPTAGAPAPVKVDVLNQSAANGTAEQVAARLEDAGWEIGRVEDFRGNVSTTTVYWLDPEQRRQARQVSRFLGGVRVMPGFDTLVDGRVSVILVD